MKKIFIVLFLSTIPLNPALAIDFGKALDTVASGQQNDKTQDEKAGAKTTANKDITALVGKGAVVDSKLISDAIAKEIRAVFDKELKPITDKVTGEMNKYIDEYKGKIDRFGKIIDDFERDIRNFQSTKNMIISQLSKAAYYAKIAGIVISTIIGLFVILVLTLLFLVHMRLGKMKKEMNILLKEVNMLKSTKN